MSQQDFFTVVIKMIKFYDQIPACRKCSDLPEIVNHRVKFLLLKRIYKTLTSYFISRIGKLFY